MFTKIVYLKEKLQSSGWGWRRLLLLMFGILYIITVTDMDEAEVNTTIIHLSLPACHQWTEVREDATPQGAPNACTGCDDRKGGRRSWGAGGLEELWKHSCEAFPAFYWELMPGAIFKMKIWNDARQKLGRKNLTKGALIRWETKGPVVCLCMCRLNVRIQCRDNSGVPACW